MSLVSSLISRLVERFKQRILGVSFPPPEEQPPPTRATPQPTPTPQQTEQPPPQPVVYPPEGEKVEVVPREKEKEVVVVSPPPGTVVYRPSGRALYIWVDKQLPGLTFLVRREGDYVVLYVRNTSTYRFNERLMWTNIKRIESVRVGLIEPGSEVDLYRIYEPGDIRLELAWSLDPNAFPLFIYCNATYPPVVCDTVDIKVSF